MCGDTIFAGSGGGKERLNIKERDLHGDLDRADKADKDFDVKKKSKKKNRPRPTGKGGKVIPKNDKDKKSKNRVKQPRVSPENETGVKQQQHFFTAAPTKQKSSGSGESCGKVSQRKKGGTSDTNNNFDYGACMQLP